MKELSIEKVKLEKKVETLYKHIKLIENMAPPTPSQLPKTGSVSPKSTSRSKVSQPNTGRATGRKKASPPNTGRNSNKTSPLATGRSKASGKVSPNITSPRTHRHPSGVGAATKAT
jgi:hypothetical protein